MRELEFRYRTAGDGAEGNSRNWARHGRYSCLMDFMLAKTPDGRDVRRLASSDVCEGSLPHLHGLQEIELCEFRDICKSVLGYEREAVCVQKATEQRDEMAQRIRKDDTMPGEK